MIADMCAVFMICRLTKDPELKYTNTGKPVLKFSVAISDGYKSNGEEHKHSSFFECVLWGKFGETMAQYLTKGQQIGLQGKLRQESWEGQDGKKNYRVNIVVDNLQMLGGKRDGGQGSGQHAAPVPNASEPDDFQDDIPFEFGPSVNRSDRRAVKPQMSKMF